MEILELPQEVKEHLGGAPKEATPAAETTPVVETPEVKPEETVVTPTPEVKPEEVVAKTPADEVPPADPLSWLDELKTKKETPAETNVNAPSNEDKLKAYDTLIADPEFKLFFEAKRAGKKLTDIAKEYDTVDYRKLPTEAVIEHYGKLNGWDEDKIAEVLGEVNTMGALQRDREIKAITAELESNQQARLDQLGASYKQSADTSLEQEKFVMQKLDEDISRVSKLMIDKEFYGAKLNDQDVKRFTEYVKTFDLFNNDGTYNVDLMLANWLGSEKLRDIQKANYAKGQSAGKQELLKEVHRPSESTSAPTKVPDVKPAKTEAESLNEMLQAIGSGQLTPIKS